MNLTGKTDRPSLPVRFVEGLIRKSAQFALRCSLLPCKETDHDIVRHAMYTHLDACFRTLQWPPDQVKALSISHSGYLVKSCCDRAEITDAAYPDHNMLDLQFEDNSFDLVVSDQVLEHVAGDPFTAIKESYRVLKPGGIAIHATVLLFQIHGYPSDYWRFTPEGLRLLCEDFGEIVDSGGWGNRYLWLLSWLGLIDGYRVPRSSWHPYARCAKFNKAHYPIVTWVVARK